MVDAHKNFAISAVSTAPSPAASGTSLVVTAGHGSRFPAVPFNAVIWPTGTAPTPANAEVVRVTNIATDTFTITRAQESSSARTVVVGDQIAAAITAKALTDIEDVQYAAYAKRTTDQIVSDAIETKIQLNTEVFDVGGNFDPTTNYRFTAPVAGYYQVNGMLRAYKAGGTAGAFNLVLGLHVNGSLFRRLGKINLPSIANTDQGISGSALLNLAADDYIEITVYLDVNDGTPTVLESHLDVRYVGA